jgi:hypothetical protein
MAARSTSVNKTSKPNTTGPKSTKPNTKGKPNTMSLAAFQRDEEIPITSDQIFELVTKSLKDVGAPEDVIPQVIAYLKASPTPVKEAAATKPTEATEPTDATEPTKDDEAEEVLAKLVDQTKARDAGGADDDKSPQSTFPPHKMAEVLLVFTMAVNRLLNKLKLPEEFPVSLYEMLDEFRDHVYKAPYAAQIPETYGLPKEFIENLARCGLVPKRLSMLTHDLCEFLGAHLAALDCIGVKIELNPEVIAQASTCESISIAINYSKPISQTQLRQIRAAFVLALSSIKNSVPEGLTFLPAGVLMLLKEQFPNIYAMVSAVNTSQKDSRMDSFKSFTTTKLYHNLTEGADIEVNRDNLDDIFEMLPKFARILHQSSINSNRRFSNQCLEVITPKGKKITLVFPRLSLDFHGLLAEGIDLKELNTVLPMTKNPSMLNFSFVSSMVASVLVACYINPHPDALRMLSRLQTLFERFDQNTAEINEIKVQKGNPVELFAKGNELIAEIFYTVEHMHNATDLNKIITPREAELFDAFFKGVNAVKPEQQDEDTRAPRARAATGLDAFDAPASATPITRRTGAAAAASAKIDDGSFPVLGAGKARPTTPLAGQWGGAKAKPYAASHKDATKQAEAPARRQGFTRGAEGVYDPVDEADDSWN